MIINGKDFDAILYKVSNILNESETNASPRGLKTKELINTTIEIESPLYTVLTNPHRKLSKKYLDAEFKWYMSGELTIDGIKEYSSMWERLINPDGKTVNSNYGYFVFHQFINGITQFDWVVNSLKNDPDSRQAIINFNQPQHKFEQNKDFVCTISNQFLIRDNELVSIVNMRSCDLIYGAGYDIPWFAYVQYKVYKLLLTIYPNLKLGKLIHNSASLHVYERHFKMIENISNDEMYCSENILSVINT